MTETHVIPAAGEARSPGVTVQELLARDSRPVPETLTREEYRFLGDEDLSKERYFSRSFHELEVERMWRRVWQMACREEDLVRIGDFVVYDVADCSLIIVRTGPEEIKALENVCPHRGRQLVAGDRGYAPRFRCAYHAWAWSLDGGLETVPCEWDFPHVDRDQFRLPEARVATWGGWVFVNPDPNCMSFEEYIGSFPEHFVWRQERLYKEAHVAKVLRCNWKVAMEAFLESYHVIGTHPQILPLIGDANTQYDQFPDQPRWNRMISAIATPSPHLGDGVGDQDVMNEIVASVMGEDAVFPLPEGLSARAAAANLVRTQVAAVSTAAAEVSDSEANDAIQYFLFPNFVPWGGLSKINYRFRPYENEPEMCIMECIYLAPFDESKGRPPAAPIHWVGPDDDWTEAPELGMLAMVFNQDSENLPHVQRGLRVMRKPGITLGNYQESRIRHLHRELDQWLSDDRGVR